MPSIKNTLFGAAALAACASAAPTSALNLNLGKRAGDLNLAGLSVTLTANTQTLPAPPAGQAVKAVTVGVGFQNYTCTGAPSAKPVSVGAVATLINAADGILPFLPPGEGLAILDLLPEFLFPVGRAAVDASGLPKSGVHFFNAAGVPTFDLTESNVGLFQGAKTGDIPAPSGAAAGSNGAVDWLALSASAGSTGIGTVYRIFTASGNPPPTCENQPAAISVPYSAQYWFFG